jgi:hypothetical protein
MKRKVWRVKHVSGDYLVDDPTGKSQWRKKGHAQTALERTIAKHAIKHWAVVQEEDSE